jgi:hypothetical protein
MGTAKKNHVEKSAKSTIKELFTKHSMEFENGMRQILGNKAYHTADLAGNPKKLKQLLQKATSKLSDRTDEIVTMDARLRGLLLKRLEVMQVYIKTINKTPPIMDMIGLLYNIVGMLLGYDWMDGKAYRTPIYYRTKSQEFADYRKGTSKDWDGIQQEEDDLVLERRRLCLELQNKGKHINQVARVLNISEYEVQQYITNSYLAEWANLLNEGHTYDEIALKLREEDMGSLYSMFSALGERRRAAEKRLEH